MNASKIFNRIIALFISGLFFWGGFYIYTGGYELSDCFYSDGTIKRRGAMCILMNTVNQKIGSDNLGLLWMGIGFCMVGYHIYQFAKKK